MKSSPPPGFGTPAFWNHVPPEDPAPPKSGDDNTTSGTHLLYDNKGHRYFLLGFGESSREEGIPSNQYLVTRDGHAVLFDPGGSGLFPILSARLSEWTDLASVRAIFLSHQDPDVSAGLDIWMQITGARVYLSRLWTRFMPHMDLTHPDRLLPIPDDGALVEIAPGFLFDVLPAHFLHSPGQINVLDPVSRILFTGDIGAAERSNGLIFVDDFAEHLPHIEGFHRRYMASRKALRKWIREVERREVDTIAPQHGPLYRGPAKDALLRWLFDLRCGVDLYE
jgi:flavorubredoxin